MQIDTSDFRCAYCAQPAELVTGDVMYPHRPDLHKKRFWRCTPCKAHVGCHGTGKTPLGRLANAELRLAKQRAHEAFDPLWKRGRMGRREAYKWLSRMLNIPADQCHIGFFDVTTCRRVVEVCNQAKQPV